MKVTFSDSSFWIALRNKRDVDHEKARALAQQMVAERCRLVVTPLVFAEVHATFSRSEMLRTAVIRDFWENPTVLMEELTYADYQKALEFLKSRPDRDFPFCDATSFVLMERMQIERALSFDRHFYQHGGFEILG